MMKCLVLLAVISCALAAPQAGLVGPSGSIGPSGLVGPTGPVQFHQPAYAFLGHAAHAHVAALNAHRQAHAQAAARLHPQSIVKSTNPSGITHQQALAAHAAALAAHQAAEAAVIGQHRV